MTQPEKAALFKRLHAGPDLLILPNAWDCASARVVEQAGFPAVATTSAGIAFSLGYPDGERIPQDEMLRVVERIARSVGVPVTADLEAGYSDVAATARRLIEAGGVGLNLEDMRNGELIDIQKQVASIHAIRDVASGARIPLVLNARTDLYLENIGDPAHRFERACERLIAFKEAGADCLFIPGVSDLSLIRRFTAALQFPINILAGPQSPSFAELKNAGVARVSLGSGLMRATMGFVRDLARRINTSGDSRRVWDTAIPFAEANALFTTR